MLRHMIDKMLRHMIDKMQLMKKQGFKEEVVNFINERLGSYLCSQGQTAVNVEACDGYILNVAETQDNTLF